MGCPINGERQYNSKQPSCQDSRDRVHEDDDIFGVSTPMTKPSYRGVLMDGNYTVEKGFNDWVAGSQETRMPIDNSAAVRERQPHDSQADHDKDQRNLHYKV